ncbi:MAG: Bro-N domain-containing protein [Proteobacteria bacterium]|nr:Bro-N domain-containing protein [Pseudomonadota bacterium]MCH9749753.1 Bro-N domain-containing protein [Pseudomonadota bacterium]
MKVDSSIILFNQKEVRRHWDDEVELWYFSVIDVISVLTGSSNSRRYWSDLKTKLRQEGSEVYDNIVQLKMISSDGKKYNTDCFSTEGLLRLIQSILSPKAEPFKLWLVKVGYERIEETEDPELAFERAMQTYLKKG